MFLDSIFTKYKQVTFQNIHGAPHITKLFSSRTFEMSRAVGCHQPPISSHEILSTMTAIVKYHFHLQIGIGVSSSIWPFDQRRPLNSETRRSNKQSFVSESVFSHVIIYHSLARLKKDVPQIGFSSDTWSEPSRIKYERKRIYKVNNTDSKIYKMCNIYKTVTLYRCPTICNQEWFIDLFKQVRFKWMDLESRM